MRLNDLVDAVHERGHTHGDLLRPGEEGLHAYGRAHERHQQDRSGASGPRTLSVRAFLFSCVGVVWFALGLGLIIAPAWMVEIMERLVSDEFRLFVLIQVGMVINLALLIGTAGLTFRALWVVVGCVGLAKGLFLIGAPLGRREAVLDWWFKRPFWEYRVRGFVLVSLATTLAYGIISL